MKNGHMEKKSIYRSKPNKSKLGTMQWKCVIAVGIILSVSGCSLAAGKQDTKTYREALVVDVFDSQANFQGIQSGWFGQIIKDKFNMELNLVAPNVAGGGSTLLEMRMAAGNVGDLIIYNGERGGLQNMVTAGLVMDLSPYLEGEEIMRYRAAIEALNRDIVPAGIYAIPSEVSEQSPLTSGEGSEPTYGPYLRWDLYAAAGYPPIETLEDLLPVLSKMQELNPLTEDGQKTYGFSFFKDWDDNLVNAAKQPCCFYGYDEWGFVLAAADGSDYQSILTADSLYQRVLKFYYEANQRGLVDPESATQNLDRVYQKYQNGQVLYSPWPWQAQPAYNTATNKAAGKGFMMADIADMKIYSYGCIPEGNPKTVISVGSRTKDPERMADFVNWLYSPEGIFVNGTQDSGATAGPQGLCWELGEDGPYLTEFGRQAFFSFGAAVPESWGGGTWEDGVSTLNYKAVAQRELSPGGFPYSYTLWDSVLTMEETPLDADWEAHMAAATTWEFLEKEGKVVVAPGCAYSAPPESTEITTVRNWCKKVIVDYSWRMIFAEDEAEFIALQNEMRETALGLGYETVYQADLATAKEMTAARVAAVAKYHQASE